MSNDVIYEEVIKDPYGFIYITTNMCDGKKYLGQKKFDDKWENYLGSGKVFKKAIKKYGKDNFIRNIVDIAYSAEELNQKEYQYSILLNVVESNDFYNLVYGGGATPGYKFSEEQKHRISEAMCGEKHHNYGKHLSNETKRKISEKAMERFEIKENHPRYGIPMPEELKRKLIESHTNKKVSQEIRDKISKANSGENNPFYGKTHSDETKEKLRQLHLGTHLSDETKSKMSKEFSGHKNPKAKAVYSPEFNKIFWGASEVHKIYGFSESNVNGCCTGRLKCNGKHPDTKEPIHWFYVLDQIKKDGTKIVGAISLGYITQQDYDNYLNELNEERN